MTQEQPTNFNREIDQMLTQSEQRIEQLRELNRPLRPWEKERLKERLSKLENHQTWDKAYLQEQLTRLKNEGLSPFPFCLLPYNFCLHLTQKD